MKLMRQFTNIKHSYSVYLDQVLFVERKEGRKEFERIFMIGKRQGCLSNCLHSII